MVLQTSRSQVGVIGNQVTVQDVNGASGKALIPAVQQPDVRGSGSILLTGANNAYSIALDGGMGVASFAVTGLTGSGATLTIEASDDGGTTWTAVNGISGGTGALFTTLTTNQQFRVNAGGRTNIRLRVSSTGTGTATVVSNAAAASSLVTLSTPLPPGSNLLGTVGIDQTTPGTTNNVTVDGTVDGVVKNASVTSATTVLSWSAAELKGVSYIGVNFTAIGSGNSATFESTQDGSTWNAVATLRMSAAGSSPVTTASLTTTDQYVIPVVGQGVRVRISTYGSGTITAYGITKRGPLPINNVIVAGGINNASADSGAPVKIGMKVAAPLSGLTAGNRQDALASTGGNLFVEEGGKAFANITTAATTPVKSGAGILGRIIVNTPVNSATITIYDNTAASGTKIGTITLPASATPITFAYDVFFATGLTIVTSGATDITVVYR